MALPGNQASIQDMPPPGGFPEVKFSRGVPKTRGPPGWMLFGGVIVATCYGMYMVGQTNIEKRQLKREKRELRVAILPFLQAEEDVRYLREEGQRLREEAEIMKNVPGWKVGESVYHTKQWIPPRNVF